MPKILIFLWQLCHKALPLRGTLLRRGLHTNLVYPICLSDIESSKHLFKDCQLARKVWEVADKHNWLPFSVSPIGCQDFSQCLGKIKSSRNSKLKQTFSFLLWSIWKSRNATVFRNKIFNPLTCLIRAKKANAEWRIRTCISVNTKWTRPSSSPSTSIHLAKWYPPIQGF